MSRVVDDYGQQRRALPARTLARLQERPSVQRADAHAFAIVMSMVNSGYTEADGYVVLIDPAYPGGLAVQDRHQRSPLKARNWLHRQWVKARRKVINNPAVGDELAVQAELARIRHAVEDRVDLWTGVAGASRRGVLFAVLHFATKAKSTTLRVSERQIAEYLQTRQATVNRALRWHREVGLFLRREVVNDGTRSSVYSVFYDGVVQGRISSSPSGGAVGTDTPLQPVVDAFSRAGLGPSAERLLQLLPVIQPEPFPWSAVARPRQGTGYKAARGRARAKDGDPLTAATTSASASHVPGLCAGRGRCLCSNVQRLPTPSLAGLSSADLAEATGLHISTVRRRLAVLAEHGLVFAGPDGRLVRVKREEAELAESLGVAGSGVRRAAKFRQERVAWQRREAARRGHLFFPFEGRDLVVDRSTGEVLHELDPTPAPATADGVRVG